VVDSESQTEGVRRATEGDLRSGIHTAVRLHRSSDARRGRPRDGVASGAVHVLLFARGQGTSLAVRDGRLGIVAAGWGSMMISFGRYRPAPPSSDSSFAAL
jgi:hypothetical protein